MHKHYCSVNLYSFVSFHKNTCAFIHFLMNYFGPSCYVLLVFKIRDVRLQIFVIN